MNFPEDQYLNKIPYPQGTDPTNCVLYCYMNVFNRQNPFARYKKENEGLDSNEETMIINDCRHLWTDEDYILQFFTLASNGTSMIDGLTSHQIISSLGFWDYENMDGDKMFVVIYVTVSSKVNLSGRHRVCLFYDGNNDNNMILCDPNLDRFVLLEHTSYLLLYYKSVHELELISFPQYNGPQIFYFKKSHFKHIQFDEL